MSEQPKKPDEFDGWFPVGVPKDVVKALMAAETSWIFDHLEGIIEAPTMSLDGKILAKPGYDKETGLYYDPRSMPRVPPFIAQPNPADGLAALAVIDDVLDEFAFVDEEGFEGASHSTAIAAILAAGIRRVLPMCPAFLIDAPGQSNGKTLLADLIATIWTGRGAGATQWAGDSAEQRKVITSILVAGDLVVNFDNVTAPIGGPAICGVMTAQENFKDRLLGSTKMLELPTCVLWIFTGNNMTVRDDMSTRVLRIRLDAGVERPDLRTFRRSDLLGYVKERRGALVHAALTILRAYLAAGKPNKDINGKPFKVSSRFNAFSDLVAASLVWLSRPDPLNSQAAVVADDPAREARLTILREWQVVYGEEWITAKRLDADNGNSVSDAIDMIEGGGASRNAVAVKLKTFEGLIIDGMRLVRRKAMPNRPTAWQLQTVAVVGEREPEPWD